MAIGIVLAFKFSAHTKRVSEAEVTRVKSHLASVGLPTDIKDVPGLTLDADQLMDLIAQDKKVKRGKLNLILVRGLGQAFVAPDIDPAEMRAFLAQVAAR